MRPAHRVVAGLCAIAIVLALTSCEREQRQFKSSAPAAAKVQTVTLSELRPGAQLPETEVNNSYEENAYALSEGQRLYAWFNCVGCHFHGGGGIGPALMDDQWIYGSKPENIFASIVEGRPNGVPSFRGKIPAYQAWQLVAYVRSLSGLAPQDATAARSDHMNTNNSGPSLGAEQTP